MSDFVIDAALKACQWELAKGHLRALVALQGSYSSGSEHTAQRFEDAKECVDMFIDAFEGDGLHE